MEITVFAKQRTNKEGKPFTSYITKLVNKKTGDEETMSAKFRMECGAPKAEDCPCNIVIEKGKANITRSTYTREDTGEVMDVKTLWISSWSKGSKYEDHSMDDYL